MRAFAIAFAFFLVAPSLAHASGHFPRALEQYVPMPMRPDCSLCHVDDITSYDAVRTPFGVSMRSRGLVAGDVASLYKAIDLLRAENVDSDGDGVPDVEELSIGTDPNAPPGVTTHVQYGCEVARANEAMRTSHVVLFGLVLFALAIAPTLRKRRARGIGGR